MEYKAYSLFEVKAIDESRRVFKGMATTPAADRVNDTIDPLGASFKNPVTLLHQHERKMPIGQATFGKPTKSGIPFEAEIPVIDEPGILKDRVDMAWGEIKHGLVRAVSIGFRPIKYSYKEDGGIDFQETEIFELSPVSIPANEQAVISGLKSMPEIAKAIRPFDVEVEKPKFIKLKSPEPKSDFVKLSQPER